MKLSPIPVNRGIIAENPLAQLTSAIELDENTMREMQAEKANTLFPDGIIKFKVLAVDPNVTSIKVGDIVSLSRSGSQRIEEFESEPLKNLLGEDDKKRRKFTTVRFNEGDVAAIWK